MVLVDIWWYWVSTGQFWSTLGPTGSVEGSTVWFLAVLGQYRVELADTWWYWGRRRQYWLVLGGTESVWAGSGWYLVVLGQYNLVLFGIKWNWVSVGLLCLYILKNMEIYLDVTIAGRRQRTRKDRATLSPSLRLGKVFSFQLTNCSC